MAYRPNMPETNKCKRFEEVLKRLLVLWLVFYIQLYNYMDSEDLSQGVN